MRLPLFGNALSAVPRRGRSNRRWRNLAVCSALGVGAAAAGCSAAIFLLWRRKQKHRTCNEGVPSNSPYPQFGSVFRALSHQEFEEQQNGILHQLQRNLEVAGIPSAQVAATVKAAKAASEAQLPNETWAKEFVGPLPKVESADLLISAAESGAPVELHAHLKTLFLTTLKWDILSQLNLAVIDEKAAMEQKNSPLEWLMGRIDAASFKAWGVIGFPGFILSSEFNRLACQLLQKLQTLGDGDPLPLLLTLHGGEAFEAFLSNLSQVIITGLCWHWRSSGFIHMTAGTERPSAVRQLSALGGGRNIGTKMALASWADINTPGDRRCKLHADSIAETPPEERRFLVAEEVRAAQEALELHGFCILKRSLNREQLERLQGVLHSDSGSAADGAAKMKETDPNVWCTRPTYGRLHCALRGTLIEPSLVEIQRVWMPLIHSYLPSGIVEKSECGFTEAPGECVSNGSSRRLFVSEMQTVNADPLSYSQSWHRDNSAKGLTVLIPLVQSNKHNGATELLPATHELCCPEDSWISWLRSLRPFANQLLDRETTVIPTLNPGDILVYDSRLLHRGTGNDTWHPRPTLVVRYDYQDSPPPGAYKNVLRSLGAAAFGSVAGTILRLYQKL